MRFLWLLLFPLVASAQLSITPGGGVMWYRAPVASGGGVAGPPGFVTSITNSGLGVTSLTGTLNPSGANLMLVISEMNYDSAHVETTPTWKGSAAGVTLWTNCSWSSDAKGRLATWFLLNPSSGSGTVSTAYNGSMAGAVLWASWYTNCSGVQAGNTNYIASTSGALSVTAASQTKDLMVFITGADDSPHDARTYGASQTERCYTYPGGGVYSFGATTKTGSASSDTSSVTWPSGVPSGVFNGGLVGF